MKSNRKQRYLLPTEHLGDVPEHPVISAALRRSRLALAVLWGIPLTTYVWRGVRVGDWGWSLIGVLISAGFGYMFWHSLVTGYTRNNHGTFLRAARPLGYWLSILALALGYAVGIAGLFLAEYGKHS